MPVLYSWLYPNTENGASTLFIITYRFYFCKYLFSKRERSVSGTSSLKYPHYFAVMVMYFLAIEPFSSFAKTYMVYFPAVISFKLAEVYVE